MWAMHPLLVTVLPLVGAAGYKLLDRFWLHREKRDSVESKHFDKLLDAEEALREDLQEDAERLRKNASAVETSYTRLQARFFKISSELTDTKAELHTIRAEHMSCRARLVSLEERVAHLEQCSDTCMHLESCPLGEKPRARVRQ